MVKKIVLLLFLSLFAARAFSQTDTIITRQGAKIPCKILEIGEEEIKYKRADNPDGPLYSTGKNKLKEMIFANGTHEQVKADDLALDNKSTPELLSETRVIKVEPFSPFMNHICLGYEQMLKVGINLEFKLGYVQSDLNLNQHQSYYSSTGITGGYAKVGVKFLLGQDFVVRGIKYAHPLKGRYIRLDADLVGLNFQGLRGGYYNPAGGGSYTPTTSDMHAYSYGLFVTYGRQFVLGDILTLDYYVGIGASGQSLTFTNPNFNNSNAPYYYRNDYIGNYYAHYRSPSGFSTQFGLSIGYILKNKSMAAGSKPRVVAPKQENSPTKK